MIKSWRFAVSVLYLGLLAACRGGGGQPTEPDAECSATPDCPEDNCSSGTWDIALELAHDLCAQQAQPCHICQVAADASVNPGSYGVLEFSNCACPAGTTEVNDGG
jgi:hypothetical protein